MSEDEFNHEASKATEGKELKKNLSLLKKPLNML